MAPLRSRKWAGSCNMAADEKQVSALIKRHEQIQRWEDSDTNLQPVLPKREKTTVQFQDGCVFLAACSSGDKEEVEKLLRSVRSADINTTNVDGLTALHQACIDDNLEMVEFLVEHGANIDACDNEGWTPLHATSSCAFLDIARYLINHNANVAAVNNDGDLPIDIAENEDMENLLQREMDRKGIDAEAARCSEEQRMLEDTNQWLSNKKVKEILHPKTGATALHVAAAKGYIKVLNLLLEVGVNINAEDSDGWTPMHAAVHWGQEEACEILANSMCDMEHRNKAGHTPFDLAENDMIKLLEELKDKQASIRKEQQRATDIIIPTGYDGKRSSLIRTSSNQKEYATEKKPVILPSLYPRRADVKSTSVSGTDHQNDQTKQGPQPAQLPVTTVVSTSTTTRPIIEDNTSLVQLRRTASASTNTTGMGISRPISVASSSPSIELRRPASVATSTPGVELRHTTDAATTTTGLRFRRFHLSKTDGLSEDHHPASSTTITVTTTAPTLPSTNYTSSPLSSVSTKDIDKTIVLSTRPISIPKGDNISDINGTSIQDLTAKKPTKSLSTGRDLISRTISVPIHLPTEKLQERLAQSPISGIGSSGISAATTTKSTVDADSKPADRNTSTFGQSYSGSRSLFSNRSNNYVPYYMLRQQQEAQTATDSLNNSDGKSASHEPAHSQDRGFASGITTVTSSSSLTPSPGSVSTTSTNSVFKRSYEPPKRDEETETQRKARAKHARQTRRSTQGVSLEDIEKAEESLQRDKTSLGASATSLQTLSLQNSALTKEITSVGNGNGVTVNTTGIPTASTTTTVSSVARSSGPENPEDKSIISGYRRWTSEDKNDSTDVSNIRASYRRSRLDRDSSSTSVPDVTTSLLTRSQRLSALQTADNVSPAPSSQSLPQMSSAKTHDEPKKDESSPPEKKEEKKESTSLRARRQRKERRSTGIGLDSEGSETGGDSKPEDDDRDDNIGSVQDGCDGSSSDFSRLRSKPYIEVTNSSGHLEFDYKKKYEDEKAENERLKKELDVAKRELQEVKSDLSKTIKQKDNVRNVDRDKRDLAKKVSELEEEIKKVESLKADNQRLKDENGALIRVISKISKQVQ